MSENSPKDLRTKALENLVCFYLKRDEPLRTELQFWLSPVNRCSLSFGRTPTIIELDALMEQLKLTRKSCLESRVGNPLDIINDVLATANMEAIEEHAELR